jgi:hypothetical protein
LIAKLGLDFDTVSRLRVVMDDDRRDLINHLGSELAGIMEDASAQAASLRGVPSGQFSDAIAALDRAAADAKALTSAMLTLVQSSG